MRLSRSSPRHLLLNLTALIAASLNFAHWVMRHNSRPMRFYASRSTSLELLNSASPICTRLSPTPDTAAIMCVRGGYGSNYLLDSLDFETIAAHPKPFFAYSDLTGIQLRLLDELGMPVFHGPMLAADFYLENGVHLESFRAALAGELYSLGAAEGLRPLKPSRSHTSARGTLYGGCLSILVSLLGTPWEPSTEGTLLFLEDTGVKPYQIDRMLWQLRKARKLEGVLGIIFGEMLDCSSPGAPPSLLEDAILSALDGLDIPIAIGLRSGHVSRENVTLTFGVEAELAVGDIAQLEFLEPAVSK